MNCECKQYVDSANVEIERLKGKIAFLRKMVTDKGSHPEYHDEVLKRHRREWYSLWQAIDDLVYNP